VTGPFWWDLLIGIGVALLLAWIALVIVLAAARPRGGLSREALRLLPHLLRLVRRLDADQTLPRGIRVRLGLLLAYIALPIDLIFGRRRRPTLITWLGDRLQISIAAGVIAFAWPGVTVLAILFVIAFWAIVAGIAEIVQSVTMRWGWRGLVGLDAGGRHPRRAVRHRPARVA